MKSRALRIAIGSDHAGFRLKGGLGAFLRKAGYRVIDVGTRSEESCDYPDMAERVARAVASGRADRGVLACGTGIGMSIAANKVRGVRAAVVWSVATAKLAAEHNWANVLCLPARFATPAQACARITAWLATPWAEGGRHSRRIRKIEKIDAKSRRS